MRVETATSCCSMRSRSNLGRKVEERKEINFTHKNELFNSKEVIKRKEKVTKAKGVRRFPSAAAGSGNLGWFCRHEEDRSGIKRENAIK